VLWQHLVRSFEIQVRDNTGSTDFQRSLAEIARSYGWPDSQIEIIDDDLGRSGSSAERRAGWQRLQKMIEANQVGAVFVATISRLSRQVLEFELFRIRAAIHNVLLYCDGRLGDPADSNDAIVSQITAMVAHFENRKRAEIMMQSRLTKAKKGEVVSKLPVGWIRGPDGKYDYDPETKDTIKTIIDTFWQTRSLHGTVKALAKAGVKIPYRKGERVYLRNPSCGRVTRILTNPCYAGVYIFGKSHSQPGGAVLASGHSKRINLPEERWIKTFNNHPPYLTEEEQQEIRSILKKNNFRRRDRPGRGPALMQGLLRCAVCDAKLSVCYPRKSYMYVCQKPQRGYAEPSCVSFTSNDLDRFILREVFKVLESPPIDMLKSALEASRLEKQTRLSWIQSERERLAHEERVAHERADLTRGSLLRVHFDALEKLERVLQEKEQFEQKIALDRLASPNDESETELAELCGFASHVPRLWHHPAVTNQEKKELMRCVIDHIVVATNKERIDAKIIWKSGSPTVLCIWRFHGRHNLVGELHAQGLTAAEIREHMAAGKTSTGQAVRISLDEVYLSIRKLGLTPHRFAASYASLQRKAAELRREGRSPKWIAQHFNEQGFVTLSGKPWTQFRVIIYLTDHGTCVRL
jgi:DNA invertase Pin-like site-specific DNA recombinase